jgi:hypothetical protein
MAQYGTSQFRRGDLFSLFWTGVAAVAASSAPAVSGGAAIAPKEAQHRSQYRETNHVRTYYEVNRS